MLTLIIIAIVLLIINPLLFVGYILLIGLILWLMFYFDKKQTENVQSAVVVGRTTVMKQTYQHSVFSIGSSGHSRFYWRTKNVPDYIEVQFDVTYTNGSMRRVKAIDGTEKYERLMSYVGKPLRPPLTSHTDTAPIETKKNQLTQGVYVIGKDIPSGRYDLTWVWGEGSIHKYVDETTTLGASNYFQWIGNEHNYQHRQCIGIVCLEGEYLHIDGNVVVEIKRSKEIEIDL